MHTTKPTSSTPPPIIPTSEGVPPTEIQNLPPELLLHIFKDLKPSEALNARTVCSGWNTLLIDSLLWKGFFARNFPGLVNGLPTDTDYQEAYKKAHAAIFQSPLGRGMCEQRLITRGFNSKVTDLIHADGKLFSATMADKIKIWDLETSACSGFLEGHEDGVSSLFHLNGLLFSTSFDYTIKVWDTKEKTCTSVTVDDAFTSVCYTRGTLFFGGISGTVMWWDLANTSFGTLPEKDPDEDIEEITCLAFGNQKLCIGSTGNMIQIWDTEQKCYLKPLLGHQERVTSLIYANGVLFSGSFDGTIKIWNIETGMCLRTYEGNASKVTSLIYAEGFLISGHADGTIKIWNLVTRTCLHTLETPPQLKKEREHSVPSLAYEKGVLFAGYDCGAIVVFDFNKSVASKQTE